MNFISPTFAISLFPRTTFVDRVSYSCGRDITTMQAHWLDCKTNDPIVSSDGRTEELPNAVCSQTRGVSDRSSWIIHFPDADVPGYDYSLDRAYIEGVKFDIIDWTTRHLNHHSCISIAEPWMFS